MGLFSIFSKKEKEPQYPVLTDYSSFVTDIHSHLIPGIDDGSTSMEESMELIRAYSKLGFKKLWTTPHIMNDFFRNTPEIILSGLEEVRKEIAKENIPITIDAAAEYYIDEAFIEKLNAGNVLTINNKYLLFEISYINPPDNLSQIVFDINIKGYTPLLAHPERYPFWYNKFQEFYNLKDAGVLFQINTNSLAGYYGIAAKKIAERMIDENMIEFIGSDMHGPRHMEALHRAISDKHLHKLAAIGVKNSTL